MNSKVTYIRLLTDCFDRMFYFYRDVIGLEPKIGTPEDFYAEFQAGDIRVSIFERKLMAEALEMLPVENIHECQDKSVLIFEVDDVDKVAEELEKKGVPLLYPPTDRFEWHVRTLHIRDPAGNIIEINAPLA